MIKFSNLSIAFFGVVALAFVGSLCSAQTCDPDGAPTVEPIQNMEIKRLLGKKWYVQEIFSRRAEDVVTPPTFKCYMHYIVRYWEDEFTQLAEQYTDIDGDRATHNVSWVRYQTPALNDAVWFVRQTFEYDEYTTTYTHTDYETYGILHWCPYPGAVHGHERVMTFTGVPNPDESLLEELGNKVASLGFPTEHSVRIDHSGSCDYELCELEADACCDPLADNNVPPMPNIEVEYVLDKFWYVQEIFFREETETDYVPPSCWVQVITPYVAGLIALVETHTHGVSEMTTSNLSYVMPRLVNGSWATWETLMLYTINRYTTVVTHTDYETYMVMHWCPFHENVENQHERVFVYTTDPAPDQGLVGELRGLVADDLGFPTEHAVPIYHHADCDYSYHYVEDDETRDLVDRDFDSQ